MLKHKDLLVQLSLREIRWYSIQLTRYTVLVYNEQNIYQLIYKQKLHSTLVQYIILLYRCVFVLVRCLFASLLAFIGLTFLFGLTKTP